MILAPRIKIRRAQFCLRSANEGWVKTTSYRLPFMSRCKQISLRFAESERGRVSAVRHFYEGVQIRSEFSVDGSVCWGHSVTVKLPTFPLHITDVLGSSLHWEITYRGWMFRSFHQARRKTSPSANQEAVARDTCTCAQGTHSCSLLSDQKGDKTSVD
jgi:hypothetical protein